MRCIIKKKIGLLLLLGLMLVTLIIIVAIPSEIEAEEGHWLYDRQGNKVGCKSPGHDCVWL
jgi:hypothetical protein